jgi:hypothetical protein
MGRAAAHAPHAIALLPHVQLLPAHEEHHARALSLLGPHAHHLAGARLGRGAPAELLADAIDRRSRRRAGRSEGQEEPSGHTGELTASPRAARISWPPRGLIRS